MNGMPNPPDFVPDSHLVTRTHRSPNAGERRGGLGVDMLVLHYTGMPSAEAAIGWLADPQSQVSSHYVVDVTGEITQMVPEALRAWHAGVSIWHGLDDINSCSIGIEIQNPGHESGYPDFPEEQMKSVEALCLDIARRHGIVPERVLAHSDIAPRRKIDPGEKFDWPRLAAAGIGHWVPPAPILQGEVLGLGAIGPAVGSLRRRLNAYGYGIEPAENFDEHTRLVVAAFQRHFRPELVDGRADRSTIETLEALIGALPSV